MIAAASRMISSRMIPRWLVIVLIVATVFNDLQPFLPLGELAKDGFVYVFPLAALLLLRNPGRVQLLVVQVVKQQTPPCASPGKWTAISSGSTGRQASDRKGRQERPSNAETPPQPTL